MTTAADGPAAAGLHRQPLGAKNVVTSCDARRNGSGMIFGPIGHRSCTSPATACQQAEQLIGDLRACPIPGLSGSGAGRTVVSGETSVLGDGPRTVLATAIRVLSLDQYPGSEPTREGTWTMTTPTDQFVDIANRS